MTDTPDLKKLLGEHAEKAYAFAYRLTGNESDAGELVQETFVRVFEKIHLYDPQYKFSAWLNKVLYRVYLNRLRKKTRRRETELQPTSGDGERIKEQHAAPSAETPENILEKQERKNEVLSGLDSLPVEMRACLVLVDIEGYSYEEAAEIMDCPVGSVSTWIFRGRRVLREKLRHLSEEHI